MPYRPRARTSRVLPRVVAALSALVAAAAVGAAPGAAKPAPVDPKLSQHIRTVNARLDRLTRQSAQLDEQYNLAVEAVAAAQRTANRAQRAADQAAASYRAAHARFVQAVTQQYQGGPSPSVGTLLTSDAPQDYLDGLTMESYLSSQFADTVHADRALRAQAAEAKRRAAAALAGARAKQADVADRRSALRQESQRFHQLLDTLTARQRRERAQARAQAAREARAALAAQQGTAGSRPMHQASAPAASGPLPLAGPVSGSVAQVIAFAEAQVGKPYSYGASGPYAYDCSGLTMASWAQAGVSLPHSAAEQYNYGTHVAYSQLQPGDLIFLYSPIGHVELYVGNDLAVSAANPSTGVVYVHPSQDMGNYTGATRLTG